ncbi:polymorphic toxin type 44 domain-containing protein [Prevotella sp. 10(H)]|uniref:polymorphic toxin type 44 domain-containing protein n=1 Tax=Prevotella sp. 10(H) TaxID=1158294 RepID=UPI0004A6BA37|nr:polymorphic toxin type 44 domain-containing protein [Prevotella sp. 10(H)]
MNIFKRKIITKNVGETIQLKVDLYTFTTVPENVVNNVKWKMKSYTKKDIIEKKHRLYEIADNGVDIGSNYAISTEYKVQKTDENKYLKFYANIHIFDVMDQSQVYFIESPYNGDISIKSVKSESVKVEPGNSVRLTVEFNTDSKNLTGVKQAVKWMIRIDDKDERLVIDDVVITGDDISFSIPDEWQWKNVILMPYLKDYTPAISHMFEVENLTGVATEYIFEKKGERFVYVHKRLQKHGNNFGRVKDTNITFRFADPVNDPKTIEMETRNEYETPIRYLYFPTDDQILNDLERAGVNKLKNQLTWPAYLKDHSNASQNEGELDFTVTSQIHGFGLQSDYLYLRKDPKGNYVGHNRNNFGNYLWGAACKALGVPLEIALLGAHANNVINDPSNRGKDWLDRELDSSDDQFSIFLGWKWREAKGIKIKAEKTKEFIKKASDFIKF